jgi:hypothetical protein
MQLYLDGTLILQELNHRIKNEYGSASRSSSRRFPSSTKAASRASTTGNPTINLRSLQKFLRRDCPYEPSVTARIITIRAMESRTPGSTTTWSHWRLTEPEIDDGWRFLPH